MHVYTPTFVGYSAAVICSVDVILPSENEKVPALVMLAVLFSVVSVCENEVESPANVQTMSEGRGLALARQEISTSSPSTTVTFVELRASTLRGTGEKMY